MGTDLPKTVYMPKASHLDRSENLLGLLGIIYSIADTRFFETSDINWTIVRFQCVF